MLFFRTVPSANTLVRWVNENAFVTIVQTRPCPTFGRPVHLRGSPHRLRPGTSPHALQIPSCANPLDGHPALRSPREVLRPARHYPRFRIWRSSFERQRDFNPPEQRAAQHALWPRLTSGHPSRHLSRSVALKQTARSPRLSRTHLPAYTCRIYVAAFRASTGLPRDWPAHPAAPPLSASCSSGQRFAYCFLQIPSRDGHPCRSANTSPCRVWRGLSPPSECALPGRTKAKARTKSPRLHLRYLTTLQAPITGSSWPGTRCWTALWPDVR